MFECRRSLLMKTLSSSALTIFVLSSIWTVDFARSLTETSSVFPAIALDYKIHVDAGKEDCIYQYIMQGSILYINFQVIKGGDGKAGFGVKDGNNQFVLPYEWKDEASYDTEAASGGYYALCIDNTFSKFSAKLVAVYLNSYFAADWSRFSEELEKLEISIGNFTTSISRVDTNMASVLQYLHHSRAKESRDYALLEDNNFYVSFWSMAQCFIIISTGGFHVYFIRKLFDSPNTGKTRVRL